MVNHYNFEFEPSFYYSGSSKFWDNNRHLSNTFSANDSISNSFGMQFRFTYGLFDKMEIGVTVPFEASISSFGVRYVVSQNEKLGVALISGVNIPLRNEIQDKSIKTEENTIQAGLGAVLSYQQKANFSFDFNAQFISFIEKPESTKSSSVYMSADAGYYVFSHNFQIIAGLGYQHHNYDSMNQFFVTIYPGVTIETGKNYIIVLNTPLDIYGKNIEKTFSFSFALTLTIE